MCFLRKHLPSLTSKFLPLWDILLTKNKTMKKFMLRASLSALSLLLGLGHAAAQERDPQIEKILQKLTLEDKAGQLNLLPVEGHTLEQIQQLIREGKVGCMLKANGADNNARLQKIAIEESPSKLPILFQEDVIHGYRTIAPIPMAEACSWNMESIKTSAAVAAREASAAGIHLTYAPMVDVGRDPRWGRILEAAGEDTYLGAQVAAARVHGFQDANADKTSQMLACVKHFAGYAATIDGRDYNIGDFSQRTLREIYLPPFQAAIDAGVASLMGAYSAYDAVPATANRVLMHDILREEMGFEGLVMTDWRGIDNLVRIGVASNYKEAAAMAMKAGIDLDMTSEKYVEMIPTLVREGVITEAQVDDAVRRVLMLKKQVGLLDNPYLYFNAERERVETATARNRQETKQMALESMVLFKNESNILPLISSKKVAVVGPLAKAQRDLLGWWACMGRPDEVETIYDALEKAMPTSQLTYNEGCKIDSFRLAGRELIAEAVEAARKSDVVLAVLGENYWMSGEGGGEAALHLPGLQEELMNQLAATGKPIVTVIVSGRPYVLTQIASQSQALVEAWMPGTLGAEALADILTGKFNPCGKTVMTFPRHEGQVPIYYNLRRTSHSFDGGPRKNRYSTTYRDMPNEPLYPFGYGLTYTSFEYSPVTMSSAVMSMPSDVSSIGYNTISTIAPQICKTGEAPKTYKGSIQAKVTIKNTGDKAGIEVVQLYLQDKVCSVSRPAKELKDFARVALEPGESRDVYFTITPEKLSFINQQYKKDIEAGEFEVTIGPDSSRGQTHRFVLK